MQNNLVQVPPKGTTRRIWNQQLPQDASHALQLLVRCICDIGKGNWSVARLTDELNERSNDMFYKRVRAGELTGVQIYKLESISPIPFFTRFLVSQHKMLLVKVPTGNRSINRELTAFVTSLSAVGHQLMMYSAQQADKQQTLDMLDLLMQDIAYHRQNIKLQKDTQQSFDLEFVDDE